MKNFLFIIIVAFFVGCQSKIRDIYYEYPIGKQLSKDDLKHMNAIYFIDHKNFAMKVDLGHMKGIDYYMPHILFFNDNLKLDCASYFPFTVDSLVDYTFYCTYTDEDWENLMKQFRNDVPQSISFSRKKKGYSAGAHKTNLVLDRIDISEFPIISLYIYNVHYTDILRAPCDRFEFYMLKKVDSKGKRGKIKIWHKEKLFPSDYSCNEFITINIYDEKTVDDFYNDLWVQLQKIKK